MGRAAEAVRGTNLRKENKALFGPDVPPLRFKDGAETIDAIGRAWVGSLLEGREVEPTRLRDQARGIFNLYWRHLSPTRSTSVSGLYANMVPESASSSPTDRPILLEADAADRDRAQEAALLRIIRTADDQGQEARTAFNELVIDPNPDYGPPWLDRLLSPSPKSPADLRKLSKAIDCLLAVLH